LKRLNFYEFAAFADAWRTTSSESSPPWNVKCDLDDDDVIDFNDLAIFLDDYWLWQACYRTQSQGTWMMSMGRGLEGTEFISAPLAELAKPAKYEPIVIDIEELLDWLDTVWLEDEAVREAISEDDWSEFIDIVKALAETEN